MSLLIDVVKKYQGKGIEKVSPSVQKQRISICESCPFMQVNKLTGIRSCGGFLTGGTVDCNGEKKELCGCNVDDKTTYKDDGCPLRKW